MCTENNVSTLGLNIYRSKDRVEELQDSRVEKTFKKKKISVILGLISLTKVHLDEKIKTSILFQE
jgi:hypothetical protein